MIGQRSLWECKYRGEPAIAEDTPEYSAAPAPLSSRYMASSSSAGADWSALPATALVLVSRCLTVHGDYFRFRAVCASWRSAVPARAPHLSTQLPWLALPFPEDPDSAEACRFFRLPDQSIHSVDLPWTRGNHCFGAPSGWLAFLDTSIHLFLLNPVTLQRIPLPPLRGTEIPDVPERTDFGSYIIHHQSSDYHWDFVPVLCYGFTERLVLSSDDPTARDCVAMAVFYGSTYAFCRPAVDDSWTVLDSPIGRIVDVVFYRGEFYFAGVNLDLYVCDLKTPASFRRLPYPGDEDQEQEEEPGYYFPYHMEISLLPNRRRRGDVRERVSLVESRNGDLLVVVRTYDDIFQLPFDGDLGHLMLDFEVYRLDVRGGEPPRWVELESLGDQALFLGPGCSVSVWTGDFPPSVCRRNCIYFGDYLPERHCVAYGGPDYGVFDYGDGHAERVPCCAADVVGVWRPSIWVTPTLHKSTCSPLRLVCN